MAGSTVGLQDDNSTNLKIGFSTGLKDVDEAIVPGFDELIQEVPVIIEVDPEEIRYSEDLMSVINHWYKSSSDEISPTVGINFCTGQTKARLAGKGDFSGFTTRTAPVLDIPHFLWVTAIKHFIDNGVIIV